MCDTYIKRIPITNHCNKPKLSYYQPSPIRAQCADLELEIINIALFHYYNLLLSNN